MYKKPIIKFVKRANQWCITYWEGQRQKQGWRSTKEEAQDFVKELEKENG